MKRPDIFFGGFFGGAIPYLLGMAHDAFGTPQRGDVHLFESFGYWVGTLLFGLVGSLVAYFMEQVDRKKAFAMGAAAPGIVLGLMQGSGSQGAPTVHASRADPTIPAAIVSIAYASGPALRTFEISDTLRLRLTGVAPALVRYGSVGFVLTRGGANVQAGTYTALGKDSAITTSRSARLFLVVGNVSSDPVDLSSVRGDTATAVLSVRHQGFVSGLVRTLGVRSIRPWKPEVTISESH